MSNRKFVAAALVVVLSVVGCEKSETDHADHTSSSSSSTAAPAATPTVATPAVPATSDGVTTAPTAAATTQPVAPAEVQKMIDQAVTYVKENKMDLADKTLTQLENMKPQIPVEYHPKIDQARKAFNAAKTGGNLNSLIPGTK
jgi:hypothetical protein